MMEKKVVIRIGGMGTRYFAYMWWCYEKEFMQTKNQQKCVCLGVDVFSGTCIFTSLFTSVALSMRIPLRIPKFTNELGAPDVAQSHSSALLKTPSHDLM
jgi:hypothetical protein